MKTTKNHTIKFCFTLKCSVATNRAFNVAAPLPTFLAGSSIASTERSFDNLPFFLRYEISIKKN